MNSFQNFIHYIYAKQFSMKTSLPFIFCFSAMSTGGLQAECNTDKAIKSAQDSMEGSHRVIKTFPLDGRGGTRKKLEFTVVLEQGTTYQFAVSGANGEPHGIEMTLYDSQRNKLGSSVYNGEYLSGFAYKVRSVGIYYLSFTFTNTSSYCGGAVVAMMK